MLDDLDLIYSGNFFFMLFMSIDAEKRPNVWPEMTQEHQEQMFYFWTLPKMFCLHLQHMSSSFCSGWLKKNMPGGSSHIFSLYNGETYHVIECFVCIFMNMFVYCTQTTPFWSWALLFKLFLKIKPFIWNIERCIFIYFFKCWGHSAVPVLKTKTITGNFPHWLVVVLWRLSR